MNDVETEKQDNRENPRRMISFSDPTYVQQIVCQKQNFYQSNTLVRKASQLSFGIGDESKQKEDSNEKKSHENTFYTNADVNSILSTDILSMF